MKLWIGAVALAAASLSAGAAAAQPWGGGAGFNGPGPGNAPRATLYELPNFQGRQITVTATAENMAPMGFNDMAQSVRLQGRWRVCEDSGYRGKCRDIMGDIPDLNTQGLGLKISSLQAYFEGAWSRAAAGAGPGSPGPMKAPPGCCSPIPTSWAWTSRPTARAQTPSAARCDWDPRPITTPASGRGWPWTGRGVTSPTAR